MFSVKRFNNFTALLAIIFFLSATISTISDITRESSINFEFSQLLEDVDTFNNEHANFLQENNMDVTEPVINEVNSYQTGQEALVDAYNNYEKATSYYSEAYGKITAFAPGFSLSLELWVTNVQYPDGDFIQEVVVKEVGTLFGGKRGATLVYYKASENSVYRNFTWSVAQVQNKWVPNFNNAFIKQTVSQYIEEFGAEPGTSIYDVNNRTTVEELFFQKVKDSHNDVKEYHIQYKLNPTLSTKLYIGFFNTGDSCIFSADGPGIRNWH